MTPSVANKFEKGEVQGAGRAITGLRVHLTSKRFHEKMKEILASLSKGKIKEGKNRKTERVGGELTK